jgi:SCY1-like protein 1
MKDLFFLTILRVVRDQATKTMEIVLARVRKYSSTMPESILPPQNAITSSGTTPRMGTPASDNTAAGWAGWAISSFTNKIASASGEMQPGNTKPNGLNLPLTKDLHSAPATPSLEQSQSRPTSSASTLARQALNAGAGSLNRTDSIPSITTTDEVVAEDFDAAWGEFGDGDEEGNTFFDALGGENTSANSKPATSPTPFDDGGEPDFAGWLNAQTKAKTKQPLPKGLNRTGPKTPTGTTTKAAPNRKGIPTRPAPQKALSSPVSIAEKKISTKPKDEEGDGWDAWD